MCLSSNISAEPLNIFHKLLEMKDKELFQDLVHVVSFLELIIT